MHIALSALWGLLTGPLIHHVAVQAGADAPFSWSEARCRRCGTTTSPTRACAVCGLSYTRTALTSVAVAVASAFIAWSLGPSWVLFAYLFFLAMVAALFLTDLDHKRIPNRITYPGTLIGAVLLAMGAWADGTAALIPRAVTGALVYTVVFGLVYLAARGGFGFGDVKLATSLGLFTAFLGWDRLLLAGVATAGIGGVIALAAVLAGWAGAKAEIPYGPPMILGSLVAIVFGG